MPMNHSLLKQRIEPYVGQTYNTLKREGAESETNPGLSAARLGNVKTSCPEATCLASGQNQSQ